MLVQGSVTQQGEGLGKEFSVCFSISVSETCTWARHCRHLRELSLEKSPRWREGRVLQLDWCGGSLFLVGCLYPWSLGAARGPLLTAPSWAKERHRLQRVKSGWQGHPHPPPQCSKREGGGVVSSLL